METESECLFKLYCEIRGYSFERIEPPKNQKGKFPDFLIKTPEGQVICEIKEINANKEDINFYRKLSKEGKASFSRQPGKRVEKLIRNAAKQLSSYHDKQIPAVIIAYENIVVDGNKCSLGKSDYLESYCIDAGMFGSHTIRFYRFKNDLGWDSNYRHGGNRQMTEDERCHISALAVLSNIETRGGLCLDIYHNLFAKNPLYPPYFSNTYDEHWIKNDDHNDVDIGWCQYIGPRN